MAHVSSARSRGSGKPHLATGASGHDPLHRERSMLHGTIHIAHVESAHATVDRAMVRGGQVGRIEWIGDAPSATLLSWSWKVGGEDGGGSSSQGVGEDGGGGTSGDGR